MILMTAGFAEAEVDTRSGKAAEAERNLSALHDQARRDGYAAFDLEARLLLAQAEIESGKLAAARAHLDKLQSDARSKGFLLIARKAQQAAPARLAERPHDDWRLVFANWPTPAFRCGTSRITGDVKYYFTWMVTSFTRS